MNKRYVLKKSQDIEKLVQLKKSVGNKYYAVYYRNNNTSPLVAIAASKKLGNAVERNYQKRVIREIVRAQLNNISKRSLLIVIKKSSLDLSYAEKKSNVEYLIRKILKEKN